MCPFGYSGKTNAKFGSFSNGQIIFNNCQICKLFSFIFSNNSDFLSNGVKVTQQENRIELSLRHVKGNIRKRAVRECAVETMRDDSRSDAVQVEENVFCCCCCLFYC